jgi:hypothetical protein
MQINRKCRRQRFQKVGESQPRGVRRVDYTMMVYSKHAGKMIKVTYMLIYLKMFKHF